MANPGIGTGIGFGLEQIGQALSHRFDLEAQNRLYQRDQRANFLLSQNQDLLKSLGPLNDEYQQLSTIAEGQRSPIQQQRFQQLSQQLERGRQQSQAWLTELNNIYREPDGTHDTRGLWTKLKSAFQGQPRRQRPEIASPPAAVPPQGAPPSAAPTPGAAPTQAPPLQDFLSTIPGKARPVTTWEPDPGAPVKFRTSNGVVYRAEWNRSTGEQRWQPVAGVTPAVIGVEGLSDEEQLRATRIAAGLESRASSVAERRTPITGTIDGQRVTLMRSSDGNFYDLNGNAVESAVLSKFVQASVAAPRPRLGYGKDENGFYSFLSDPLDNHELPNTRNYNVQPPANIAGSVTQGIHWIQGEDGQWYSFVQTSVRTPGGQPSGQTPHVPTAPAPSSTDQQAPTPGDFRQRAGPPPARPGVSAPQAAGIRGKTSEGSQITKVMGTKFNDAMDFQAARKKMEEDAKIMASNPQSNAADIDLLANHIRLTYGIGKGARAGSRYIIEEALKSRSIVDSIGVNMGNILNSGGKLTPGQRRDFIGLARNVEATAWGEFNSNADAARKLGIVMPYTIPPDAVLTIGQETGLGTLDDALDKAFGKKR